MSWDTVKLIDVSSSIQTGPFGSQLHQSDYSEEGIPVVMPKDLINGRISVASIARVDQRHVQRLSRHIIKEGDILYSRRGDVGRCAFAGEKEAGWLCGTGCLRVSIDREKVNPQFVFFQLQKPATIRWVINHAVGATMLNLNTSILSDVPLEIPPLDQQNRIVEILASYDDLIEINQSQIKLLEEAAQRLYKEWFVDLRYPGHENVPVVDGVPEGWKKGKLSDIADIIMGQSPKSEYYNQNHEGLPFHQGVGSYGYRFVCDETFSTSYTRIAPANSVLFSVRAPVGRLNITKNRVVIGRGLAAMNHKEGFQSYLFYMLKERFYKEDMVGNGSIFASISKEELLGQVFVLPPITLAKKFNILVSSIDEQINSVDSQIKRLTEARDRLLPKLMNGEIEV